MTITLTSDEMIEASEFIKNELVFEHEGGHWNCSMGELKYKLPIETYDDIVGFRLWNALLTGKDDMKDYDGVESLKEIIAYEMISRIGYEGLEHNYAEIDKVPTMLKFKCVSFANRIGNKAHEMRGKLT